MEQAPVGIQREGEDLVAYLDEHDQLTYPNLAVRKKVFGRDGSLSTIILKGARERDAV